MLGTVELLRQSDVHAREIVALFGGDVARDRSDPVFRTPLVVLLFTNRCGSNLLADYLSGTGLIGGLSETTNHPHVAERKAATGLTSYPEVFAADARAVIEEGRLYGIKASVRQLAMLLRWNVLSLFPGLKLVHVVRRNVLEQAISMVIAEQSGQWTSEMAAGRTDVAFDVEAITHHLEYTVAQNAAAPLLAEAMGVPLLEVVYEEFTERPHDAVFGVLRHVGIPTEGVALAEPRLRKQASAANEAFLAAYGPALRARLTAAAPIKAGTHRWTHLSG